MNTWALLPIAVVILGFALRQHPARVILMAALVAAAVGGMQPLQALEEIGDSFLKARFLLVIVLALPVIAVVEAHGLRELARQWIVSRGNWMPGRLLTLYLLIRQVAAALGLTSLGGHAQMVRPLVAPMAEAAAEARCPDLPDSTRQRVKATSAATDNVGLFFGEDIFIAFGAVLLMQAFFAERGVELTPLSIALWGIPTAILAFAIHAFRLWRLDRQLAAEARSAGHGPRDGAAP